MTGYNMEEYGMGMTEYRMTESNAEKYGVAEHNIEKYGAIERGCDMRGVEENGMAKCICGMEENCVIRRGQAPRRITADKIEEFTAHLRRGEHSIGTIEKYLRDVRRFAGWLKENGACVSVSVEADGLPGGNLRMENGGKVTDGVPDVSAPEFFIELVVDDAEPLVSKEAAIAWKQELIRQNYAPATVNSMLAAVNAFFRFAGWGEFHVKALKIQKKTFRDSSKNLTKAEYERLVKAAYDAGKVRLALLLETICATGIRVSEVKYITVEAAEAGRADVSLKGKIRTILLPKKLCRKLLKYAKKEKIGSGEIFLTRNDKSLSRGQIWAEMKTLCEAAGVEPSKVFPHNLRHLFARTFFKNCKDIVKLADLMGHSNVETTRIYLISTGEEHERWLNRLKLVS